MNSASAWLRAIATRTRSAGSGNGQFGLRDMAVVDSPRADLGLAIGQAHDDPGDPRPALGVRNVGERGFWRRPGVGVVDRTELTLLLDLGEQLEELAWLDLEPQRAAGSVGSRMHPHGDAILSGHESAALVRCLGACVLDHP